MIRLLSVLIVLGVGAGAYFLLSSDVESPSSGGGGAVTTPDGFTPPSARTIEMVDLDPVIAALLPKDCLVVMVAESGDALESAIGPLVELDTDLPFDPYDPLRSDPRVAALIDGGHIATGRPYAIGFSVQLAGVPQPIPSMVVPVKNTRAALAAILDHSGLPVPTPGDGYLGFTLIEPTAGLGLSPMKLPKGALAVHVDLAAVVTQFRPMINGMLAMVQQTVAAGAAQSGGIDTSEFFSVYLDTVGKILDSAESFDIAVSSEGGAILGDVVFTAIDGSPLAEFAKGDGADLWSVAGSLDPSDPMSFVMGTDSARFVEASLPMWKASLSVYPEESRASMQSVMDQFIPIMSMLGGAFAFSGEFAATGMKMSYYADSNDAEGFVAKYAEIMSGMVRGHGLRISAPTEKQVAGMTVQEFVATFELAESSGSEGDPISAADQQMGEAMKALYGEEGMRVAIGGRDEQIAMSIGGDDTEMERVFAAMGASPSALPLNYQREIAAVAGKPFAVAGRIKLMELVRGVMELNATMGQPVPPFPDDLGPAPLLFHGSGEGRVWQGSISLSKDAFKTLNKVAEMATPQPAPGGGF
jgi:hypothetical protein